MGAIYGLSSRHFPAPEGPAGLWLVVANLAHAPLFGILSVGFAAWFLALPGPEGWPRIGPRKAFAILFSTLLYAAFDEGHQAFVPGRFPSVFDFLTDAAGAFSAFGIVVYLGRERATERGLRLRLLAGGLLCLASAVLSSFVGGK